MPFIRHIISHLSLGLIPSAAPCNDSKSDQIQALPRDGIAALRVQAQLYPISDSVH